MMMMNGDNFDQDDIKKYKKQVRSIVFKYLYLGTVPMEHEF